MPNKNHKKEKPQSLDGAFVFSSDEKKLFAKRKKRFDTMFEFKKTLGIDSKCDRMDALYTPHYTSLENPGSVNIQTSAEFKDDKILTERARKSMPLAFEKITTAQAMLVKENPKAVMRAENGYYSQNNYFIQETYYANFSGMQKKEVMKKYTYHLAKYGIAYWREYIKKTFRKQHETIVGEDGKEKTEVKWVYDVNDVVGENIHPKNIILDNNCISLKDVNKPANDLIIISYLTKDEFESVYPESIYENSQFVKEGQAHMLSGHEPQNDNENAVKRSERIQVLIYENVFENLRETWANGVPIQSVPLPGDKLSVSGDKWIYDKDNYDAIGVAQICELYLPLIDDIVNTSNERLRLLVRPNEDWFNGIELADESDDMEYGSASVRKFSGSPTDIKYSNVPARSEAEVKEKEEILEEIDRGTFVPRNLGGGNDTAKTAYQSSLQKEAALRKLSLPLDSIRKTVEDAANLDLSLYKILYSEPLETISVSAGDKEFDEGLAILEQYEKLGVDDNRVVVLTKDDDGNPTTIARRKFRTFELPIAPSEPAEDGTPKGFSISEKKMFWEMIPDHFNWNGRIEIIGESFLPVSKALEDEQTKETIEYLMNVPTTDEMGRPTLMDANGMPYMIDRVKLVKERARMNKNFDPEQYIVPFKSSQGNAEMPMSDNPLEDAEIIKPKTLLNLTNPGDKTSVK